MPPEVVAVLEEALNLKREFSFYFGSDALTFKERVVFKLLVRFEDKLPKRLLDKLNEYEQRLAQHTSKLFLEAAEEASRNGLFRRLPKGEPWAGGILVVPSPQKGEREA